jgi:hypothetical protein
MAKKSLRASVVAWAILSAGSSFADEAFIPQCPAMLPQAESFAQDCLTKARTLSRVFHPGGAGVGQPETHSAYFREAPLGSHFALGCTLDWQRRIRFLGIYYSTDGGNFAKANTAPIRFIDFQGNVGLMIDGAPVTFVAIRQFGSENIPRLYKRAPTNCESARLENGYLADGGGQFKVEGDLASDRPTLKVCFQSYCRDNQFKQFFKGPDASMIYHALDLRVFIGTVGNILVENDFYRRSCGEWYRNLAYTVNIVSELCAEGR